MTALLAGVTVGAFVALIGWCRPEAIAESVVEAANAHLPSGVTLELRADSSLPQIAIDADKVHQVLANLLENAVKYSPNGGRVKLTIEPNGGFVRFAVSDEGLGIRAASAAQGSGSTSPGSSSSA